MDLPRRGLLVMVGKTAPIRPQDRTRMDTIKQHIGCVCCLVTGHPNRHATIEHVTDRGRRIGGDEQHQHTIGLCEWHHFGRGWRVPSMGPSLANGRKPFEAFFGPEEILIAITNWLLKQFEKAPWPEYNLPLQLAVDAAYMWLKTREQH